MSVQDYLTGLFGWAYTLFAVALVLGVICGLQWLCGEILGWVWRTLMAVPGYLAELEQRQPTISEATPSPLPQEESE